MPGDTESIPYRKVPTIAKTVLALAEYQKQRWLRNVLMQLGTPEAKAVLRQLERWTHSEWPRS